MKHLLWSAALIALFVTQESTYAQSNRLLAADDWAYDYITRLQQRGHLLSLHPTAHPYRRGDVRAALDRLSRSDLSAVEDHWVDLLEGALGPGSPDGVVAGASVEGGVRAANSDRLDPLRPLGDTLSAYPYLHHRYHLEAAPLVGEMSLRHDLYYDDDPDGLDVARRLLARSEQTYVGYGSDRFSAYLGRFSHHWGQYGDASSLLSTNAHTFDQLHLRVEGTRFALYSILGELDSMTEDGRFTGRAEDDSVQVGSVRRFLAAHRWDWRPSRHLVISIMEAALYSGTSSGVSLRYLNPLHPFAFVVDNTPKNDDNNGLVAGLLWAQVRGWTLHGQLLIDDVDLLGEGDEPSSFTAVASLTRASVRPWLDLHVAMTAVAARTYNTHQPEGRYTFMQRGLATQFSDYVRTTVSADVYVTSVPGLRLTPQLHVLSQGERDLRQPFPERGEPVDAILDGTVERTVRPALQVRLQRTPWWWIQVDAGLNATSNSRHVAGRSTTRLVGQVNAGMRLSIDRLYP